MRFFKSVKFRLTVWYLAIIVILLMVFGSTAYLMLSGNLYRNLDDALKIRLTEVKTTFEIEEGRGIFAAQPGDMILLYNSNSVLLQRFGPPAEFTDIDILVKQALSGQDTFMTTVTETGQEVRLYATPVAVDPRNRFALIIGRTTVEIQHTQKTFRDVLGFSGLAVLILAGIGGLFLASRALKPVDRITRTAQSIGESDLSRRIDVHSEDELGRLATTLNHMIERLEAAFNRQREFTADASHELRTPLAVMQAESTLALSKERTGTEYRKSLELISQEITYMSAIIGKLLFLARSDTGKEPLNLEAVNLKELLTELSADAEVLARDKGLRFSPGIFEDLNIKGDRVKLRQLFLNILENAIWYTPEGGSISASITKNKESAVVAVSDTGIGIPPEHLPRIFERFYRVDKARSRAEGGAGLGLAIAKYIAEMHGGRIEVDSMVGKGSIFRVILPLGHQEAA